MTQDQRAAFRMALVHRLSMEPSVRHFVRGGVEAAVLAKDLGVDVDALREAAEVQKLASANARVKVRPSYVLFAGPRALYDKLVDLSGKRPTSKIRSLLHAALQTTCEPTKRSPSPIRSRVRKKGDCYKISVPVAVGLHDAIVERARAHGLTPHRYVMSWILDFLDGRVTGRFPIDPVGIEGTFERAENYVLPRPEPLQAG